MEAEAQDADELRHEREEEPESAPLPGLPPLLVGAVLTLCALPAVLSLLGVDFGNRPVTAHAETLSRLSGDTLVDTLHLLLQGSFVHTILEWTAFCAAAFTVLLACTHFTLRRDAITAVLCVALFWSGSLDAIHTLLADRLIQSSAPAAQLIPFTWAICRIFSALTLAVGVCLALRRGFRVGRDEQTFLFVTSIAFGIAAYAIVHACARRAPPYRARSSPTPS